MNQIRDRVAGLDVHRDTVVAATRMVRQDRSVETTKQRFATTSKGLVELARFLTEAGVETVAMEATGVYWRPVYYALEGLFDELWLCNAQHVRNVPGRKTDLNDAEWLADVAAHGMVRPSFVPPPEIRELRELTRHRKSELDERGRELQRLEKVLQDAGIKLTSVASKVWSQSSRAMIEAMIAGERDPKVLAEMAKSRLRAKLGELEEAFSGHFGDHHAVICRQIIDHVDFLDRSVATLTEEIAKRLVPFEPAVALLCSIPGIGRGAAEVMIAEMGADMSRFPTPGHLCAWAGVAPANHESAGHSRPAGTRHGNPWLRRTLVQAAKSAGRTKSSYYSAAYSRIARRRGANKATVAIANSLLTVAWHLLSTGARYEDLGADYFTKHLDPEREARRLVQRIQALGFTVELAPQAA